MFNYNQMQTVFYRGLSLTLYNVDRVSLSNMGLGAGYRVWNTDSFDVFFNGAYGKYMPKVEGVYDISSGTKYDLNFTLTPAKTLSHGFQGQVYARYQKVTAEVAARQLDYAKTEIGLLAGYFINFSTFESLK
jgi:hypothetical protein